MEVVGEAEEEEEEEAEEVAQAGPVAKLTKFSGLGAEAKKEEEAAEGIPGGRRPRCRKWFPKLWNNSWNP